MSAEVVRDKYEVGVLLLVFRRGRSFRALQVRLSGRISESMKFVRQIIDIIPLSFLLLTFSLFVDVLKELTVGWNSFHSDQCLLFFDCSR